MTTIFFVCQRGNLELKARILASSLRHFSTNSSVRLTACVPTSGDISINTRSLFRQLDVNIQMFEPQLWSSFDYPIGNKLDASVAVMGNDRTAGVFIDTDMLALRQFDIEDLPKTDIAAVPIFAEQVFTPDSSRLINSVIEKLNSSYHTDFSPFPGDIFWKTHAYNAGFVCLRNQELTTLWKTATSEVLRSDLPPRFLRPFADQVALAILARKSNVQVTGLENIWNKSGRSLPRSIVFYHYHNLMKAFAHPRSSSVIKMLNDKYSCDGVSVLGEISSKDLVVNWLKRRKERESSANPASLTA